MSKGELFGGIFLGLAAGVTAGIFIGMAIRQKRANMEVESVKSSFRKYFKSQIEDEKKKDIQENEKKAPETEKANAKAEVLTTPYEVLTKEEMLDILNGTDVDVESILVDEDGHHAYMNDDILTSKVGMTPQDISETLKSGGSTIYVRNNITDKLYEIYFGPDGM